MVGCRSVFANLAGAIFAGVVCAVLPFMKLFLPIFRFHLIVGFWGAQAIAGLFTGCSKSGTNNITAGAPEVLVTEAIQQDVPVVREWIDRCGRR